MCVCVRVCVCVHVLSAAVQEDRPLKRPVVEEYSDSDLYDDLSVSTVTVGPNVTDYEVGLCALPLLN